MRENARNVHDADERATAAPGLYAERDFDVLESR
jgi:hypothetical protein